MSPTIAEVHATLTAPGQLFEMEEVVIRGIPTRTWKNAPADLRDVLMASRAHGDRVFLVYEDETLTFEEHFRVAAHLATILRDRFGVQPGDRVAIAMRNFPEWSMAFWAATVGRRRRRAAERVVDRPRAGVRAGRLGLGRGLRRRRAGPARGRAPGQPCPTCGP